MYWGQRKYIVAGIFTVKYRTNYIVVYIFFKGMEINFQQLKIWFLLRKSVYETNTFDMVEIFCIL